MRILRRLGLRPAPAGTSTAKGSRAKARRLRLAPGIVLLATGDAKRRVRTKRLTEQTWVVGRTRSARHGVEVAKVGPRGWLVSRRSTTRDAEPELEVQTTKLLGQRHVAWLLERYQIDCVLDVGANKGQYAKALRRNGFTGHIASFEPVPEFVEAAELAAADDDRWTVHHVALGAESGTLPMRVQRSFSSLLPSSDYGLDRFETLRENADSELIDVPLRRLDTLLDDVVAPLVAEGIKHPRLYLKMDTQGFDLEAFAGLGDRVADIVAMQSEVALLLIYDGMPRMAESIATYEAAGFEITGLYPVTRERDGRVVEYDVTMVRVDQLPATSPDDEPTVPTIA